jgi:hypothetical protein
MLIKKPNFNHFKEVFNPTDNSLLSHWVVGITQINMIEKWNFLNFKKWGEIAVFFGSSNEHICF